MAAGKTKDVHTIRRRILGWYRKHGRDFIWRRTRDPYAILVSEIMLQQTQAARVVEKLPVFLRKYPTLRSLANSSKPEVIRAWHGLGYNNRAVRLRELAITITASHGGRLPDDPAALERLPGIGRYTAHAVSTFAFRRAVPVVEVNVHRVLSRLFWRMKGPSDRKDPAAVWNLAGELLPRDAWTWNQSVIELGATVCKASRPDCTRCPVRSCCSSAHLAHSTVSRERARSREARKPEPSHAGIPRRLWRGRVVEALRHVKEGQSLAVERLGKSIKPDFNSRDVRWLTSLVGRLEEDGIVRKVRSSAGMRVALSAE